MLTAANVTTLVDLLGPTLVATAGNTKVRGDAERWASGELEMTAATRIRLLALHTAFNVVSRVDGDDVARAWVIGANPHLDDRAPVLAVRRGDVDAVIAAACAYARQ